MIWRLRTEAWIKEGSRELTNGRTKARFQALTAFRQHYVSITTNARN